MWTAIFIKSPIIRGKVYTISNGRLLILKSDRSMKHTIFLMVVIITFFSCNSKNNNMERYDFERHKELGLKVTQITYKERGDTIIFMSGFDNGGAYEEYPPSPAFYIMRKDFYPNGVLESKGKIMGDHLWIGIWQYYDQRGNLIKEVDEDGKFGAIKPEQILQFLDKKGHINLETGEGRPHYVFSEGKPSYPNSGRLSIVFIPQKGAEETPNSIDFIDEERKREYPFFSVTVRGDQSNGYRRTYYQIHGETGKILETEDETDPAYYI